MFLQDATDPHLKHASLSGWPFSDDSEEDPAVRWGGCEARLTLCSPGALAPWAPPTGHGPHLGAGEVKLGPRTLNPRPTIPRLSLHGVISPLPTIQTNFGSLSFPRAPILYVQGLWHPEPLFLSSRRGLVHTKEVNQCYTSVSLKFMELFGSKTKKNKTD